MDKRKLDRMIALFLMILCIFLFGAAKGYPEGAGNYPRFLLLIIFLLAAVLMVGTFRNKDSKESNYQQEKAPIPAARAAALGPYLTFGMVVLYVILIDILGFFTSSCLFAGSLMFFMGVRSWRVYIFSLAGVGLFIYLLFVLEFDVQLPRGIFF